MMAVVSGPPITVEKKTAVISACNEPFILIPRELKGPVGTGFSFDPKPSRSSELRK